MKILFDHHEPFLLAHGGMEILCGETMSALCRQGVEVEHLRWWDRGQRGDIIHCYGRPNPDHIRFAHAKGMRYVFHELLTAQGSRPLWKVWLQGVRNQIFRCSLPSQNPLVARWNSYGLADAIIASTSWEAKLMRALYRAPGGRLHVIPTGVHPAFFEAAARRKEPAPDAPFLCLATITERKGVIELIRAAVRAGVPLDIVGRPYSDSDPYYHACKEATRDSGGRVRLQGAVEEPGKLAALMAGAPGFILWSRMETESTAALAAAAAGLPLLLTDLPWARCAFHGTAMLISPGDTGKPQIAAKRILEFKRLCAGAAHKPVKLSTWDDVAGKLKDIYTGLPSRCS